MKAALVGSLGLSSLPIRADEPQKLPLESKTSDNPIQAENRHPGSHDWQLTRVRVDGSGYRSPWIEGYCSRQSVAAGEVIDIMVSTNPPRKFKIEIFRTGYYDGAGARLMKTLGPFDGETQPDPEMGEKSLYECRWNPAVSFTIPDDWTSGVYLGRLTTLDDGTGRPTLTQRELYNPRASGTFSTIGMSCARASRRMCIAIWSAPLATTMGAASTPCRCGGGPRSPMS